MSSSLMLVAPVQSCFIDPVNEPFVDVNVGDFCSERLEGLRSLVTYSSDACSRVPGAWSVWLLLSRCQRPLNPVAGDPVTGLCLSPLRNDLDGSRRSR